jgi:hypothetical protein
MFTLLLILSTGCVELNYIGLVNVDVEKIVREFRVDEYKIRFRVHKTRNNDEYICSFILWNQKDRISNEDIKSTLEIKKYSRYVSSAFRNKYPKQMYLSGLYPVYDSMRNRYKVKYKLVDKGKYEVTLKLDEISGKKLESDIIISFDQDVL